MWLWIASDAMTKLIPVMQVGARNQEMAYSVVHELKGRLAVGCVPVFSTDDLKHYFYALTAHFGRWKKMEEKKPVWVLLSDFVYSQVARLLANAASTAEKNRRNGTAGAGGENRAV